MRGSVLDQSDLSAPAEVPSPVVPASPSPPADPRPPPGNPPPTTVADHELLRVIGRGAYGEVWLARHTRLGTLRAVKIVRRDQFTEARPFQREFEGIRRYEPISRGHPNLVAILHVGGDDECFYYVMELADDSNAECGAPNAESGKAAPPPTPHSALRAPHLYSPHTLRSELKQRGALPIARCLEIAHALAGALAHLHAHGLVHRDVKPSNIIFVDGAPKLADVGLVAGLEESRSFVGTEGYIPPEGPGAPSADCFSLGKVLYEMSTGRDRHDFPQLPADLRESSEGAALVELNEILLKACDSERSRRYPSAAEMRAELDLLRSGHSIKRRVVLKRWWSVLSKVAVTLAGVGALAGLIALLARGVGLANTEPDGPLSTNADANVLWEKGMEIVRYDRYEDFRQAYTNFHRAIELDPQFVRPYVGLLELRYRQYLPGVGLTSMEEMRAIAQRLGTLAPNLAATHCAQSAVQWADWDYPQAERCALQAIRADPNYELGHTEYAFLLALWGRPAEARAQLAISKRLRPSKATVFRVLGQSYYVERDYAKAMDWARKALYCDPHESVAFWTIGCAYRAMDDYPNALTNIEQSCLCEWGDAPEIRKAFGQLRQALKDAGPRGYWLEFLRQTEDGEFYWKAVAQLHLGNTEEALTWLEKSYATHEHWPGSHDGPLSYLLLDQDWDVMHDNPRFRAVLEKVGFTKVRAARNL